VRFKSEIIKTSTATHYYKPNIVINVR